MPRGKKYYIIYKPKGCLSQFSNEHGKRALGDFFDVPNDVYPVGRLDEDSEGLLILTNDKSLNSLLLDPSNGHWKTYWAQLSGQITKKAIKELSEGVHVSAKGGGLQNASCKSEKRKPSSVCTRFSVFRKKYFLVEAFSSRGGSIDRCEK